MRRVFGGALLVIAVAITLVAWRACGRSHDPDSIAAASVHRRARSAAKPASSASISGRVTFDGGPAVGVRVCAVAKRETPVTPQCVLDNADGTYAISLPPDRYYVRAMGRPYLPASFDEDAIELAAEEHRTGVDIDVVRGGAELAGLVHDREGQGIAHAMITVGGRRDRHQAHTSFQICGVFSS